MSLTDPSAPPSPTTTAAPPRGPALPSSPETREAGDAAEALQRSQALYLSLVEQMPTGIFRKDADGRYVLVNEFFCRYKGRPRSHFLGHSPEEVAALEHATAETNPGEAGRIVRLTELGQSHHTIIMETGRTIEVEEEYPGPDGDPRVHHVVKSPVFDAAGKIVGTQGFLFDITARRRAELALQESHADLERRVADRTRELSERNGELARTNTALHEQMAERERAERKLEALHRELVDASRQAGMAEVATGVLHNVGNVLNSVNVTVTLLEQHLKQMKLDGVARLAALLEPHRENLGAFFANDPRARNIPSYLGELAKALEQQRTGVLREVAALVTNVEHIKEIVSTQQAHARMLGVIETLAPAQLAEDALKLSAAALARHHVQVLREFAPVPDVRADKHKILQILVNLITNAKYACDDSPHAEKHIRVRLQAAGPGRVALVVADNGVGIPPENLTRIFSHGFTTRKTGHGFGLHMSALAAKELGGSLTAHSDGPGRGATFTLELPTAAAETAAA